MIKCKVTKKIMQESGTIMGLSIIQIVTLIIGCIVTIGSLLLLWLVLKVGIDAVMWMTTTADVADSTVVLDILSQTNDFLSIEECTFFADKGYDVKAIYNAVKDIYHGECFIPINKRNTKNPKKLSTGHPICEAGLAMHKDGKFSDNGRTRQKYCCPFKRSKSGCCPCNHKNWNNGKKTRGCTKYVTLPDDY